MNAIKNVLSKELTRVFKDKKMIFSIFILPVALIMGMFFLMSVVAQNADDNIEQHVPVVYIQNAPQDFKTLMGEINEHAESIEYLGAGESTDSIKDDIYNEKADLLMIFPVNFSDVVKDVKLGLPDIEIYYNESAGYSNTARAKYIMGYMESYKQEILEQRYGTLDAVMAFQMNETVLQDEARATGKMLGSFLPYFVTLLLFAGAMGLGVDTIAGEKERGTMASLLLTPVKRTSIVMGKLISLMILSVLSAVMYVISIVAGMPLMASMGEGVDFSELAVSFTPVQIAELAVIIIGLVFLYVALVAVVAVFAKSVKEASSYVMPLYILVIAAGIMTMSGTAETTDIYYIIPLYNSSIALQAIFSGDITMVQFALTAVSTFATAGIVTLCIARAFNSEKVMFNA